MWGWAVRIEVAAQVGRMHANDITPILYPPRVAARAHGPIAGRALLRWEFSRVFSAYIYYCKYFGVRAPLGAWNAQADT